MAMGGMPSMYPSFGTDMSMVSAAWLGALCGLAGGVVRWFRLVLFLWTMWSAVVASRPQWCVDVAY